MGSLWSDVRFGLRMLVKTPVMSGVAVITLGLGVGLTTHMFSSVYGTSIRGLPIPDDSELHYVGRALEQGRLTPDDMLHHTFVDLREAQTSFQQLEAFYQGTINLAGDEAAPERVQGAYVTAGALSVVGVAAHLGRVFLPGEDGPFAPHQIVIGYDLWRNRFGADPGVIGRRIRANGFDTEIIGVMPEGAKFPFLEDAWLPLRQDPITLERGYGYDVHAFGRLREGVSVEAANQELLAISTRIAEAFPETNRDVVLRAGPYEQVYMPESITTVFWIMLAATFGVLLIACTNVANILLARASVRTREVAVRTALGASRWRVVRQLLVEAGILASVGGLVGFGLSELGAAAYIDVVEGIYKPYWIDFDTHPLILLFTGAVTLLAALLAGVLPALRATGVRIGEALKDESRGSSSLRLGRLTHLLVVSEIAVSCALLVMAGFMVRSVVQLNSVDYGFDPTPVLVGRVGLFETDYPGATARDRFNQEIHEQLAAIPGVRSAALGTATPGLGSAELWTSVEGQVYESEAAQPVASVIDIGSDYFRTLGVEFLEGRDLDELEARLDGVEPVAVVSRSFADRFVGEGSPLGVRVKLGSPESEWPWARIVGVVPDTYVGGNTGGIGNDRLAAERLFLPLAYRGVPRFVSLHLRTEGDPALYATALRQAVAEVDPNLPVYDVSRLDDAIKETNWAIGLFGGMFSSFGVAALLLAAAGLYGVISFSVRQRTREMGVRMALGADGRRLLATVMRGGLQQLAVGMGLGLVAGAGIAGSLEVIMYGVSARDTVVYVAIVATLGSVGLLAVLLPARAVLRTDPASAMRDG